jgi:hypothetical protein
VTGPDEGIQELSRALASFARDLKGIDIETVEEAQILGHLMAGGRTIPELMESLYGVRYEDSGYASTYMKIRRSLQSLSYKGYVSRPLFGKGRPYRLTEFAVAKLTNIGGKSGHKQVVLVSKADAFLYAATTILGGTSVVLGVDVALEAFTYIVFAFLLGISVSSAVRTVRRVA